MVLVNTNSHENTHLAIPGDAQSVSLKVCDDILIALSYYDGAYMVTFIDHKKPMVKKQIEFPEKVVDIIKIDSVYYILHEEKIIQLNFNQGCKETYYLRQSVES